MVPFKLILLAFSIGSSLAFSTPSRFRVESALAQKQIKERFIQTNAENLWDTYHRYQDVSHITKSLSRSARSMLAIYRSMRSEMARELLEVSYEVDENVWTEATQKAFESIEVLEKYAGRVPDPGAIKLRMQNFFQRVSEILQQPLPQNSSELVAFLEHEAQNLVELSFLNPTWKKNIVEGDEIKATLRMVKRYLLLQTSIEEVNAYSTKLRVHRLSLEFDWYEPSYEDID